MYGLYDLKHHIVEVLWRYHAMRRTDKRTRKDRANQPLDAGRLSFAKSMFMSVPDAMIISLLEMN